MCYNRYYCYWPICVEVKSMFGRSEKVHKTQLDLESCLCAHRPPGRWRIRSPLLSGPWMGTWSSTTTASGTARVWTLSWRTSHLMWKEERRSVKVVGFFFFFTLFIQMVLSCDFHRADRHCGSHRGWEVLHDALPLQTAGSCWRWNHHWWCEDSRDRAAWPEVQTHHHSTGTCILCLVRFRVNWVTTSSHNCSFSSVCYHQRYQCILSIKTPLFLILYILCMLHTLCF